MAKTAYAQHTLQYVEDGELKTVPAGQVVDMSDAHYADFEKQGAVRPATNVDKAQIEDDGGSTVTAERIAAKVAPEIPSILTGEPVAPTPHAAGGASDTDDGLTTKFRGAAKWSVLKGDERLVDGLDTREAAEAWISDHRAKLTAGATGGLLD
jgi:hypothetical protein